MERARRRNEVALSLQLLVATTMLSMAHGYFPEHRFDFRSHPLRASSAVTAPPPGRILTGLLSLLHGTEEPPGHPQALQQAPATSVPQITPGCDFYQTVEPGERYWIYSPNYPRTFPPHVACRWFAVARVGWRMQLECREIQLDEGDGTCRGGDLLLVSLSGDGRLRDASGYCGVGSFVSETNANLLNVVFEAGAQYIPGNRFMCILTTVNPEPPPTTVMPPPTQPECSCGNRYKKRIVGGVATAVNEFPMMAGLVELSTARVFCGATIISAKRALTAAHCLTQRAPSSVAVLVGDHDLASGSDTDKAAVYRVKRFVPYPQYNSVTQANDIAVVEIIQDFPFSTAVGPVCLPFRFEKNKFEGDDVLVLGWGSLSFGGETSSVLQKAELTVVSDERCQRAFSTVTSSQICTFRNGSDSCQSDSGGPVLWQDEVTKRLHLVGIISYGVRCASDLPAVNTRITAYLDWIQQVSGDDFCVA